MIKVDYFFKKLKDVKFKDLLQIFSMFLALLLTPFFYKKFAKTWLFTEEPKEARDNGFCLFKKIRENHPEQNCIYAIDKSSVDYLNVKKLGTVIQYGSLKHWIIYFTCQFNISSQKGGKPNPALCSFIELNNIYNAHNIFLQHGITKDNMEWLHAEHCRFQLFLTSAKPEQDYIEEKYGYEKGVIQLLGFPRFDYLHNFITVKNQIVIMPTWRNWFILKSKQTLSSNHDFTKSNYLKSWIQLLESERFNQLIDKYKLKIIFYPHRNMQEYFFKEYSKIHTKAVLADWREYNLQDLLKESEMMITDYSSVFFDMIYMKKPVLFYQFDSVEYRKTQYQQGYFDYNNNAFGKSFSKLSDLLQEFQKIIVSNYTVSDDFLDLHKEYFPLYDDKNSERVYKQLKEMTSE